MQPHASIRFDAVTRSRENSAYYAARSDPTGMVNAGGQRILVEHRHRLERITVEILADQRQLFDDVAGHGDDMAADFVGLENIEELARARPEKLGLAAGL